MPVTRTSNRPPFSVRMPTMTDSRPIPPHSAAVESGGERNHQAEAAMPAATTSATDVRRATRRLSEAKLRPAFSEAASGGASSVKSASRWAYPCSVVTSIGQYVLGTSETRATQTALAEPCHARPRPGTRGHCDSATGILPSDEMPANTHARPMEGTPSLVVNGSEDVPVSYPKAAPRR